MLRPEFEERSGMNRYKIVTSYDGTDYYGWQVQKNLPTIALTMQDVFYSVFKTSITLRGASRTDAGVHAIGHVAFFDTNVDCDVRSMQFAWSNALPKSIIIKELLRVDPVWVHPHANIVSKTYWYHLALDIPSPFFARYSWYIQKKVDMEFLREALQLFVGTYDFKLFCSGEVAGNTVRTVQAIELVYIPEHAVWRIAVTGKSFLRYMIRRMVGAAIDIATNPDLSLTYIREMLEEHKKRRALFCAPARGLVLHSIKYQDTP